MSFFSRFFSSPERVPLPSLEEIFQARNLPTDLPGLDAIRDEFPPLDGPGRERWGDAVRALVDRGLPLPPPWLDAQYDVSPRLVPTWAAERDGFFYRPHLEGLSVRVVIGGQLMPPEWLTLWNIAWEEALDRGMDLLREHSAGKPLRRLASGVYQGAFGDGLDAHRFLLPELWSDLFPGQNTFVAIPAEDELLVAPQVLLPQMVEVIGQVLVGPKPRLMGCIYQQVQGSFLPASLQDPHPMAQPQRELRLADLIEAYRAQETALPPELGAVAPTGMLRTQQGRSVSYTTWQEGQPVLLPETDLVGFVAADGKPLGIYFRQTLPRIPELHGHPVDIWGPRRIRYEGFPTADQLARLECLATGPQMAGLGNGAESAHPHPAHAQASDMASAGVTAQATSPVPAHLRGLSLGIQRDDD